MFDRIFENPRYIGNLIFDWSGVISNDLDVVLATYNHLFSRYGVSPLTAEEFRNEFELPYEKFCRRILGDSMPLSELQEQFREIYTAHNMMPEIIPGVEDVLAVLKQNGVRMVVLSSHSFVSREAQTYFPGRTYFLKIYEDIPDKTRCIKDLMREQGFNPSQTCYVGDMEHDIHTGKHAGVKTIAITTGYQSRRILSRSNPDYILDNLADILPLLNIS